MDQDKGQGDARKFPAEELERLYREGQPNGDIRIRGDALNQLLNTNAYVKKAWYVVIDGEVKKL